MLKATEGSPIEFHKLANRWYADVDDWVGSADALEMVAGADDLLNYLFKSKSENIIRFSELNPRFL